MLFWRNPDLENGTLTCLCILVVTELVFSKGQPKWTMYTKSAA